MDLHLKNRVALIGIFCSLILVLLSIAHTSRFTLELDNWGLIKVLPISYIVGIILFSVFHLYIIFNSKSYFLNVMCILLLIIILFGTATLLEGTPRFIFSYKASTNIDYILRSGHSCVDWSILGENSRFQHWPLVYYFSVITLIISKTDINTLLLFAPVASQILYMFPLLLIFNKTLSQYKHIFIACSFFFLMNWVNQDFLSNQNMGLFFSLLVISILVLMILGAKSGWGHILLFLIVFFCVVGSHGLSSIATFAYVSSFLVIVVVISSLWRDNPNFKNIINQKLYSILILFMFAVLLFWAIYVVDIQLFSSGVRGIASTSFSNLFSNYAASQQLADRGTYAHIVLAKLKTYYAAIFCFIALMGLFHYLLKIKFNLNKIDARSMLFFSILFVNFILYISGMYGDEAIIRAFLLSLICLSFFCTYLIDNKKLYLLLLVFFILSMPMHVLLHYSNENENYVSPAYISSTSFFYQNSIEDTIVLGTGIVEARKNFERYSFKYLSDNNIDDSRDFQLHRWRNEMVYIFISDQNKGGISAQGDYNAFSSGLYNLIYHSGVNIYSWGSAK